MLDDLVWLTESYIPYVDIPDEDGMFTMVDNIIIFVYKTMIGVLLPKYYKIEIVDNNITYQTTYCSIEYEKSVIYYRLLDKFTVGLSFHEQGETDIVYKNYETFGVMQEKYNKEGRLITHKN